MSKAANPTILKEKLGNRCLDEKTIITDTKTNITSKIVLPSADGLTLKPISAFDTLPEFFVTYEELTKKFEAGEIDILGYEHTPEDHKIFYLVTNSMIDSMSKVNEEEKVEVVKFCPVGADVQTFIFSKDKFTKDEAIAWAKNGSYQYENVESKKDTYRILQKKPSYFRENSFRAIILMEGLKAIIGFPKKPA